VNDEFKSRYARPALLALLCLMLSCAEAAAGSAGNSLPAATPAEIRFQQGLRLAAANQTDAAIRIFSGLTTDYPLLPQPYVQLAALYAQQGKLSRAVESLHAAMDRRLDDATMQQSLGDLYVELAKQTYRSAADAPNPSPGAAEKYAALEKSGSRAMSKPSVQP